MQSIRLGAVFALSMFLAAPAAAAPGSMRIYEAGELAPARYTVVARLWVESWRSAFVVPGHADPAAAIAELGAEAARRGADALTNVVCLRDGRPLWGGPQYCYALGIKIKNP